AFPAAMRASPARSATSAPVRSIAFTSMCAASTGASSAVRPVRMFTTPGGTSEVASTSARVTAGSGTGSLATTTAALPVAITGASTLTSPNSPGAAGAITATTPGGSGPLEVKDGPPPRVAGPGTPGALAGPPPD